MLHVQRSLHHGASRVSCSMLASTTTTSTTTITTSIYQGKVWTSDRPVVDKATTYKHQLFNCPRLQEGKSIHANILRERLQGDSVLATYIIHMYLRFGSLCDARHVFESFTFRDVCLWTAIISAHARFGQPEVAMHLFHLMHLNGIVPNGVTFLTAVNLCILLEDVSHGRKIYERARDAGYASERAIGNSVLNLYGSCASLEETRDMFDEMETRDAISWTTLMRAYNRRSQWRETLHLFHSMQLEGVHPDKTTFIVVLSACTELQLLVDGVKLHGCLAGSEMERDVFVASSLINMYNKCGELEQAWRIFNCMSERTLVSWNIMIAAYVHHGFPTKALGLLHRMQLEGVRADKVTLLNSLTACCNSGDVRAGRIIHLCSFERGYAEDTFIATSLLNMYSKCRSVGDARRMFQGMEDKSVVTWNAMISAYAQNGRGSEAVLLFHLMDLEGVCPNKVTFATLLDACGEAEALRDGEAAHERVQATGTRLSLVLGTSLVRMYGKCSCLGKARQVFDTMEEEDVVLWTTMLGAYIDHGKHDQALELFHKMKIKPDNITFVCAVDACANSGSLEEGEAIFHRIKELGYERDVLVGTVLCYMFIQFGCLDKAGGIFNRLDARSVVSWNAMIGGYGQQGLATEALECFRKMLLEGTRPDDITYAAVLDNFVSQSYLGEGRSIHRLIAESGYEESVFIGTALLNMYGKCGSLPEARRMFFKLPNRTTVPWNALIAAYSQSGRFEESLHLFMELQLEGFYADNITFQCIISACSHAGLVDKGCEYMMLMIEDHGIVPHPKHYSCMVDLLGRAGWLREAEELVVKMPAETQPFNAMSLLSSCRTHGDSERGQRVAELLMKLAPARTGAYSLLSNIVR